MHSVSDPLIVICGTAATLGFVHTVIGPDHYLPFVLLGRANNWGSAKLAMITILCGIGHVLSSIVLGMIGIGAGIMLKRLELIESVRGEIASWALIAFGLVYAAWGLRKALRGEPHEHAHIHEDGEEHIHLHAHQKSHLHIHPGASNYVWWLFIIFILGPCEPLIPLLMFPAATSGWHGVALVSLVFGTVTITTMTAIALLAHRGLMLFQMKTAERYVHALAGGTIVLSGMAVKFLGL